MLPKCTEDIKSAMVTDKETNHPDWTSKTKAVSIGIPAGFRYSSVNEVNDGEEQRQARLRSKRRRKRPHRRSKRKCFGEGPTKKTRMAGTDGDDQCLSSGVVLRSAPARRQPNVQLMTP